MATPREQARAELRRSIDVLPERTRKAMLHGLGNNTVITGAFAASNQGACPMMVAHREGGRTSCCTFPEAWDKFTGVYGRHIIREATPYEVQILCEEIEASLVPLPNVLSDAIAEHQAIVEARRQEAEVAAQQPVVERAGAGRAAPQAPPAHHRRAPRPQRGDRRAQVGRPHAQEPRGRRSRDRLALRGDARAARGLRHGAGRRAGGTGAAGEFDFDAAEAQLTR